MMIRHAVKLIAAACLLGASGMDGGASSAAAQNQNPCGLQPSRKIDEYGTVSLADEKARLEKFRGAVEGVGEEDAKGFIIGYGGRGGRVGDGLARADRAKEYLVEARVFINTRLNVVDCGRREEAATELWITPVGAAPPTCSPTVSADEPHAKSRGRRSAPPRPTSIRKPRRLNR